MANRTSYIAVDVGAESGRVVLGHLKDGVIQLDPVHRFPNGPIRVLDHLHWDVLRLFGEIKKGIGLCASRSGVVAKGIGMSTWGVDFGLLDKQGELLGVPYCYRDQRTDGVMEQVFAKMPREEVFGHTGIQFMPLNTLYQLYATALREPRMMDIAETFLMIPDLLNYWMTGTKACEITIGSTSQLLDVRADEWSRPILDRLGLPSSIFPLLNTPGTVLGPLHSSVAEEVGLTDVPVISSASHDTAAAVAATPVQKGADDFAYINAGTWSIVGVETSAPALSERALEHNLTNERGVDGTYMLRKNIMGLWILQECRNTWAREGRALEYGELCEMAAKTPPCGPIIEPDHGSFLQPGDMPSRIRAYCQQTDQQLPADIGATVRCVLEGLALKYRLVISNLEEIWGHKIRTIHLMGGGSKSRLLCQLTANVVGTAVLAGPDEATTLGNIMLQAIARGDLASVAEGRDIVRNSFDLVEYEPRDQHRWDELYQRFLSVREPAGTLL